MVNKMINKILIIMSSLLLLLLIYYNSNQTKNIENIGNINSLSIKDFTHNPQEYDSIIDGKKDSYSDFGITYGLPYQYGPKYTDIADNNTLQADTNRDKEILLSGDERGNWKKERELAELNVPESTSRFVVQNPN